MNNFKLNVYLLDIVKIEHVIIWDNHNVYKMIVIGMINYKNVPINCNVHKLLQVINV